jgi:Flp pilus assembly secretin CpaC
LFTSRIAQRSALWLAVVVLVLAAAPAQAADDAQALARAVALFEAGDYLAAQEVLSGVDRSKLNEEQQAQRDGYLERINYAIRMQDKASRDLEDAELAMAEDETAEARKLLQAVLDNEFAADVFKKQAQMYLADLEEEGTEAKPAAPMKAPEPMVVETVVVDDGNEADMEQARVLCGEADELVRHDRYDAAAELYMQALELVPGYPVAVEGLDRIRQHEENMLGSRRQSLIDQIKRQDAIAWQRAQTEYRTVETLIRQHVANNRYAEANQQLLRARQIIESNKQFADPVVKYENLRTEVENLADWVREQEREYNEIQVKETRREIQAQQMEQRRESEENKKRQVESLMKQAQQHRKDGDLQSAINVLKQVHAIDPHYEEAMWLMDSWNDEYQYRQGQDIRDEFYEQTRRALQDVERSKIPWWEPLVYPDDWPDRISSPFRVRPGEERENKFLISALENPVRVDFRRTPLHEAIQRFAASEQLNLHVDWNDLKLAGVERDVPIEFSLPQEITLKKALTEVLHQAGGGVVDLSYEVSEGVLTIATKNTLDRRVYTATYNINDLLMDGASYDTPPTSDLSKITREANHAAFSANYSDQPWRWGDDDDDEAELDRERQTRVDELVDLIRLTVSPESWKATGGNIGTIAEINGQLVVTQNSAGHQQLSGLLDKLRQQQQVQIAIEARFLTVSSHYLEELGLDVDVFLNQGNAGYDYIPTGIAETPITTDPVLGSNLLLPRSFSQVGFVPAVPTRGAALGAPGGTPINLGQPYVNPVFIPSATGGSVNQANATPVPIVNNVLKLTNPANLSSDVPGTFAGNITEPAFSIFGSFLDSIQVDFLLRATMADSRTTVLTAPSLVLQDGDRAWIAVTIQSNYVSTLTPTVNVGAAAQAPVTATINAGATLTVDQAAVTADKRYVRMRMRPGVTRLNALNTFQSTGGGIFGSAFVQLPELSTQLISTQVIAPDGGTLLIGGQKVASETEVEAGVPILSKIPILKRAYSSRTAVKDEQTLLILIKPRILIMSEQEDKAFPGFTDRE